MYSTKSIISAIGASTLGGLAYMAISGSSRITRPRRSLPEATPDHIGFNWEPIGIQSADGTELSAWLIPNSATSAAIIVLHGFGGNKGTMLNIVQTLAPGFNVLALDVRGHGESGGTWTSVGHYERYDAIAAAQELRLRGFGPIGVLGISMGAAISILAAAESPLIRAVVADSSFAVLRHAVRGNARLLGYPSLMAELAAYTACSAVAARLRHARTASDPIAAIAHIAPRPTLLIHCDGDAMIPVTDAQALYAASGDPCELWIIPEMAHAESYAGATDEYRARVTRFFRRHLQ
ncbi:MAG: alpha/beta hydrolase [Chloroflexota bacterium]